MEADPIRRIYEHVEALRTIAAKLPDDQCGLALILSLLGDDLQQTVEKVDSRQGNARPESACIDEVRHELGGQASLPDAQHMLGTAWQDLPSDDAQGAGRQRTCDSFA